MPIFLISTSGFDMDSELLVGLDSAGWIAHRNPYGRKLTEEEVTGLLSDLKAEAIVAGVEPLTAAVFDANPQLRVISRVGIGLDNIDMDAARKRGIIIRSTPDAPSQAVAELTIGLIFSVLRGIPTAHQAIRTGGWKPITGRALGQMRLGIVGLGRAGRKVAQSMTTLGARVEYYDPFVTQSAFGRAESALDLAAKSDVITLHVPNTLATADMVDAKFLATMPEGSYLINTARGELVDEDALLDALRRGHLAGAALDVFKEEPYTGPLAQEPNVVLTAHMGSKAAEVRARMEYEALMNMAEAIGIQSSGW